MSQAISCDRPDVLLGPLTSSPCFSAAVVAAVVEE
jgi:hypothetical protein